MPSGSLSRRSLTLSPRLRTVFSPVGLAFDVFRSGRTGSVNSVPRDGGGSISGAPIEPCWIVLLLEITLRRFWLNWSPHSSVEEIVPLVIGLPCRCACSRCELMGRKNPCAVIDGMCDRLIRLLELSGLPAWLECLVGGGPLRDTDGRDWTVEGGGG